MYRSPNIVRVIKSRRLRWAGHVARLEESWSAFKILTGNIKKYFINMKIAQNVGMYQKWNINENNKRHSVDYTLLKQVHKIQPTLGIRNIEQIRMHEHAQ